MNTKTILFAAMIAAMILPFSGMQSVYATHEGVEHELDGEHGTGEQGTPAVTASGENLTIEVLQEMIRTSESRIAHYEALLASDEALRDHRNASIITLQVILDGLDAIVDGGGLLTGQQTALYNYAVDEINLLERANRNTANEINNHYLGIARHQAVIDWAQAELDSREA